jgi:hypothetical protein
MIETIDLEAMRRAENTLIFEEAVSNYIRENELRVLEIEKLNVLSRIFGLNETWDM